MKWKSKPIERCHCPPTRMGVLKETDITNCWHGFADTRIYICNWWECIAALKNMLAVSAELNFYSCNPEIPLLGIDIYPSEMRACIYTKTCMLMSIAALSIVTQEWGEPTCQSAAGWNTIQHWEWTASTHSRVDGSHEHNGQQKIRHRSVGHILFIQQEQPSVWQDGGCPVEGIVVTRVGDVRALPEWVVHCFWSGDYSTAVSVLSKFPSINALGTCAIFCMYVISPKKFIKTIKKKKKKWHWFEDFTI